MHSARKEFEDSANKVLSDIEKQLESDGSFVGQDAKTNAALHRAFSVSMASRLNIMPHEVYERYGLRLNPSRIPEADTVRYDVTENQKVYAQFAGPNAHSADSESLSVAKNRVAEGEKPEVVRQDTGWFKGVDNKWRFEISDHLASLSVDGITVGDIVSLSSVLSHDKIYEAYPSLKNMKVKGFNGDEYDGAAYFPYIDQIEINVNNPQEEQLSSLLHEVQHVIQFKEGFAIGGTVGSDFFRDTIKGLGEVRAQTSIAVGEWELENRHLLKDAERAKEVSVSANMYESYKKLMEYSAHDRPSSVFRHILAQIDWIHSERASNNEEFRCSAQELYREIYRTPKPHKMDERNRFLREYTKNVAQFLRVMIGPDNFKKFESDERKVKSIVNSFRKERIKANDTLSPLEYLNDQKRQAGSLEEQTKTKTPFQVYQSLAGEVESRNVQERQHLPDKARKHIPPKDTQDIDSSENIVIYHGRKMGLPNALYQASANIEDLSPPNRGSIDFTGFPNKSANISLFEKADKSTFLHESAHFFWEVMTQVARQENAPDEIVRDVNTIVRWGGIDDIETYAKADSQTRRDIHEKFARGFEAYLFEGRSPSRKIQNIFDCFRSWLKDVYRSIKELNVNLNNDVRAVMDRIVATDISSEMAGHESEKTEKNMSGERYQDRYIRDHERRYASAMEGHAREYSSGTTADKLSSFLAVIDNLAIKQVRVMKEHGIEPNKIRLSLQQSINAAANGLGEKENIASALGERAMDKVECAIDMKVEAGPTSQQQ